MSAEPAIAVRDLVKSFGHNTVVDHVSLTVERGEIAGFLGPNGSGKTTTIRLMCGLLTPDSGTGRVLGRDILTERGCDVYQPLDLGIGRCRLVVAGRASASAPSLDGALYGASALSRVATKYPRSAERHFARRGLQVEIVNVSSSVELAPIMGLSDLIVDLVETGTTLVENGLEVKEDVYAVSTLLIANRVSYKVRAAEIGPLVARLRDAVAAAPAA